MTKAIPAACALLLAAACSPADDGTATNPARLGVGAVAASAPTDNPASPALPARWIDLARDRRVVAVAGTYGARDAADALARGEGMSDRPLHRWQAIEAATAVLELTGSESDVVHAFGFGRAPDPDVLYTYRALSGRSFRVAFLGRYEVGPGDRPDPVAFGAGQARVDAESLRAETARRFPDRNVLLVGHSWGGAVVDHGQAIGVLDAPAISLGAPVKLYANPLAVARLREEGDHGTLWVARRPDDPVRDENVVKIAIALFDARKLARHDYTMASHGVPERRGGVWGLVGPGVLCSARHGGGCPPP